jgi:YD repeat-containing protein
MSLAARGSIFRWAQGSYTRIVIILLIYLSAPVQSALAGTPSYIGPYKYSASSILGSNGVYGFDSAEAAMQGALEQSAILNPSSCAHRIVPPTDPWQTTGYDPSPVEGTEAGASTRFSLYYQLPCGILKESSSPYTLRRKRLVCLSTQRYLDQKCVDVEIYTPPTIKGANLGASCPSCGEPINPSTGNMWHIEDDYVANDVIAGLSIQRVYNSYPYTKPALQRFGAGWSDRYSASLRPGPAYPTFNPYTCWRRRDTQVIIYCDGGEAATSDIPESLIAYRGDGKTYVFRRVGNEWLGEADTSDRVSAILSNDGNAVIGWIYNSASTNTSERFDAKGRLLSIAFLGGNVHRLTYSAGDSVQTNGQRYPEEAPACLYSTNSTTIAVELPLCITDNDGRQINYRYAEQSDHVIAIIQPDGQSIRYEYNGTGAGCADINSSSTGCLAKSLTKVIYPDGTSRSYFYNEVDRINAGQTCVGRTSLGPGRGHLVKALTGLIDEAGTRYISWGYDCSGNATSSEKTGGVERVKLAYAFYSTGTIDATVTYDIGDALSAKQTVRKYSARPILGVLKNGAIDGSCPECGVIASRSYDTSGNLKSTTDRDGTNTTFVYDIGRNLQISKTENSGGALARTTSTEWHPRLRLPVKVAEPNRITTYTYDDVGNILSRTEQATSDINGASGLTAPLVGRARAWTYAYDAKGKLAAVTGPRTDIADLTSYEYDVAGNLHTMRNAAGHITTFGKYDANGRVGEIVAPNGTVTTLTYTSRGWLSTRTVTGGSSSERTTYEYYPTGNLRKVITPDGKWLEYDYDAAQRLVRVADKKGNRTEFSLDLRGNILVEETFDNTGTLRKRIARAFDETGRLTEKTGGGF